MEFSERLKFLRKKANETQPVLAAAIGVSTKQIVRFESGEQKPGFDNLWKLADHFQVTVDFLMGREPPSGE
jgi:transcriptional regulator with XRE-family HTH domain